MTRCGCVCVCITMRRLLFLNQKQVSGWWKAKDNDHVMISNTWSSCDLSRTTWLFCGHKTHPDTLSWWTQTQNVFNMFTEEIVFSGVRKSVIFHCNLLCQRPYVSMTDVNNYYMDDQTVALFPHPIMVQSDLALQTSKYWSYHIMRNKWLCVNWLWNVCDQTSTWRSLHAQLLFGNYFWAITGRSDWMFELRPFDILIQLSSCVSFCLFYVSWMF